MLREACLGGWFFLIADKQHLKPFKPSDYYKEWTLKRPEKKKDHNAKLASFQKNILQVSIRTYFLITELRISAAYG